MRAARQGRLHPVLHLLHLAQHQGGADRLSDRADAGAGAGVSCGRTSSPTRPTSFRAFCRTAAVRRSASASSSPRHCRRVYGIYNGFELCENARGAGQRGISPFREIRVQGLGLGPARQHQGRHRRAEPHPPRQPGAAGSSPTCAFCPATTTHILAYRKTDAGPAPTSSSSPSTSIRTRRTRRRSSCRCSGWGWGRTTRCCSRRRSRGAQWVWRGSHQRIALDPEVQPAMVFRVRDRRLIAACRQSGC